MMNLNIHIGGINIKIYFKIIYFLTLKHILEQTVMTNNVKRGILIIILSTLFFATMDGVSRYLADTYNVFVLT